MYNKVLILGNGFDLDLGWKTRYKDFIQSEYWPLRKKSPDCPMAEFLQKCINIDLWYDLESMLKYYASDEYIDGVANPKDELFFNNLIAGLTQYIREEEKKAIRKDSFAINVLNAVITNGYFSTIYSFNYTDLNLIARKADIQKPLVYESVHGCVANNSIILGVDDHSELRDGYSYLRKVFSEYYTSHPIRYSLKECDEVIFFGHSLGETDYPYFSDFFSEQSRCKDRKDGKRITIFTKDHQSRFQILEQLRKMNQYQTEHLQNDNIFKIIMTDKPDTNAVSDFFNSLNKESKATEERMLDNLSQVF